MVLETFLKLGLPIIFTNLTGYFQSKLHKSVAKFETFLYNNSCRKYRKKKQTLHNNRNTYKINRKRGNISMKDLSIIVKRIRAKAEKTAGLQLVAEAKTLEKQMEMLCHLANSFNKVATQLVKQYGKNAPKIVEELCPFIYEDHIAAQVEEAEEKAKIKHKKRMGKAEEQAKREIELEKQMAAKETGRIVGYARVSTNHQNLDRQLAALQDANCEVIFQEKKSGKNTDRLEFKLMLEQLKAGDTLIIADMTRLARSTSDLFRIVEELDKIGVALKSLKEHWLDTSTAQGKLMLTIFSGLAEFEREVMLERQAEGIAIAKAKGVQFGKKLKNDADIETALDLLRKGEYTCTQIAKMCNISRTTLWRRAKELNVI